MPRFENYHWQRCLLLPPAHMAPPEHHKHTEAASAWAGNCQAQQNRQLLNSYCITSSAGSIMCFPFLSPATNFHENDRNWMPLQPLLLSNLRRFAGSELLGWGTGQQTYCITWQVTRPEEVRKQSWKLLSVLEENSLPKLIWTFACTTP